MDEQPVGSTAGTGTNGVDHLVERVRTIAQAYRESAGIGQSDDTAPAPPVGAPPAPAGPADSHALLQEYGTAFVVSAYRHLLGREPDEAGLHDHLSRLDEGRANRLDLLRILATSQEGRARGGAGSGLAWRWRLAAGRRWPLIGPLVDRLLSWAGLAERYRQSELDIHRVARRIEQLEARRGVGR